MKTLKSQFLLLALLIASACVIYSCKKDHDDTPSTPSVSTVTTTISGMVLDESNAALTGVTVTAYGSTTTTNQFGIFVLENVSVAKKRCVVTYTKAGFFNRADAFIPTANTVNYVRIVMISDAQTHTVSAVAGGTITLPDNSSIQFPASGFVMASSGAAYNGTVTITFKHLMPGTPNFGFTIPGGDLAGKNLSGDDVTLYTFGMIGVTLTGSGGEALQLAPGKNATITMPVAAMQMPDAKPTIPLWYFDESTALWMEEGSATLVGNNYVGTVSHFSWWNCDIGASSPFIKGKVVDCQGNPMPNIVVTVNGWATTITNQLGEYQGQVPAGITFTVQVLASNNTGILSSQIENVPVLTNNQVYIVATLVVPCPSRIAGTLQSCSGSVTTGLVRVAGTNGFSNYQFTTNGAFNLAVPENSQLLFDALASSGDHQQTLASPAAPNTLNIGNVLLCDTGNNSVKNSIIINGGPFSNELVEVVTTIDWATGGSQLVIHYEGISLSGYDVVLNVLLEDTLPGVYSYDSLGLQQNTLSFSLYSAAHHYEANLGYYSGNIILFEFGSVGNRVVGSFSGTASMIDALVGGGQGFTVSISGNFNVTRTQ